MHQKGAIGHLESSVLGAQEGQPGAICGSLKEGEAGPDDWFGIHHSLSSSEELRERIGKSRDSSKESESESDSFSLGQRQDLDRA
jgi:hypothetical protein